MKPQPTSNLIKKLVDQAEPVKPLSPFPVRLFQWMLLALACGATGLWFMGIRDDLYFKVTTPAFILETAILLGLFLWAAYDGLRMGVPGDAPHGWRAALSLSLTLCWLLMIVVNHPGYSVDPHLICAVGIFLISLIPTIAFTWLLSKAYPLNRTLAGALAGASSGGVAALAMQFVCAREQATHLIVWHFMPVFLSGAIGALLILTLKGSSLRYSLFSKNG